MKNLYIVYCAAALSLLAGCKMPSSAGITGDKNWQAIAMSSDGERLAAVVRGGHLYTSDDYGVTWKDRSGIGSDISGNRNWQAIAMSSNGRHLAAVVFGGYLYTSSKWRG